MTPAQAMLANYAEIRRRLYGTPKPVRRAIPVKTPDVPPAEPVTGGDLPREPKTARGIIERVCVGTLYGYDDIVGRSRIREVTDLRHQSIYELSVARPDLSLTQIARMFNRDHATILHTLRKFGVESHADPKISVMARLNRADIERMRADGMTWPKIGDHYGIADTTVKKHYARMIASDD